MINLNLNYILFIVYVFVTAKFHFLPFLFHEKLRNYARFHFSIRSLPLKVSNCTSNSHLKINTIGMVEWKEDVRLKNWGRKLVGAWRDTRGQVNALGDRDARSFARIYAIYVCACVERILGNCVRTRRSIQKLRDKFIVKSARVRAKPPFAALLFILNWSQPIPLLTLCLLSRPFRRLTNARAWTWR